MTNIFENAYLGKPYKTEGDGKVIYLRTFVCNGYKHYVSNGDLEYSVDDNGRVDKNLYPCEADDIISEWTIDEEELDELVMKKYPCNCSPDERYCDCCINPDLKEAYKVGFRAKEAMV